jgi:hypothetical protein
MRRTIVSLAAAAAAVVLAGATPRTAAAQQQQVRVHYEILVPAELRASTAERARVVSRIDSGTVIVIDGPEELGPVYTRLTWNGQSGWVRNADIRRVITVRDVTPVRMVDTVRVTRVDSVVRYDTVVVKRP